MGSVQQVPGPKRANLLPSCGVECPWPRAVPAHWSAGLPGLASGLAWAGRGRGRASAGLWLLWVPPSRAVEAGGCFTDFQILAVRSCSYA
jgi:hypothetical protein